MTHRNFRRRLVNGGWSCYFGGDYVSYRRGRASIDVETDTDDFDDGYFELDGETYCISDVCRIDLFPSGTLLWMYGGYSLYVHY